MHSFGLNFIRAKNPLGQSVVMNEEVDKRDPPSEGGNQRDLPEKMADAFELGWKVIVYGTLGLFALSVVLIIGSVLIEFVSNPDEREQIYDMVHETFERFDETVGESLRDSVEYCKDLDEALTYDARCVLSDDCVITRDELVEHEQRLEWHAKYCSDEN